MRRPALIGCVLLLVSLGSPKPASAGFWAWLEEWSGPGPMKGWTFLFTACLQDRTVRPSPIALDDESHKPLISLAKELSKLRLTDENQRLIPEHVLLRRLLANPPSPDVLYTLTEVDQGAKPAKAISAATAANRLAGLYKRKDLDYGPGHFDKRWLCGYADQGFFKSAPDDSRGFAEARAHMTDIGPSVRLHDGLDLGGGVGWAAFSGKGVTAGTHVTITPVRLVLRPTLMVLPEELRKQRKWRWTGMLSIYWKETYVVGQLSADKFGSQTDTFKVDGELVRSFGLNLDLTGALYGGWWRR